MPDTRAETPIDNYRDRLLRLPEVEFLSGFKKSSIYARVHGFPAPVKVGRANAWRESEVNAWIASLSSADSKPASRPSLSAATAEQARA